MLVSRPSVIVASIVNTYVLCLCSYPCLSGVTIFQWRRCRKKKWRINSYDKHRNFCRRWSSSVKSIKMNVMEKFFVWRDHHFQCLIYTSMIFLESETGCIPGFLPQRPDQYKTRHAMPTMLLLTPGPRTHEAATGHCPASLIHWGCFPSRPPYHVSNQIIKCP